METPILHLYSYMDSFLFHSLKPAPTKLPSRKAAHYTIDNHLYPPFYFISFGQIQYLYSFYPFYIYYFIFLGFSVFNNIHHLASILSSFQTEPLKAFNLLIYFPNRDSIFKLCRKDYLTFKLIYL